MLFRASVNDTNASGQDSIAGSVSSYGILTGGEVLPERMAQGWTALDETASGRRRLAGSARAGTGRAISRRSERGEPASPSAPASVK